MSVRYSKYLSLFTFICDLLLLNGAMIIAQTITYGSYVGNSYSSKFLFIVNVVWIMVSLMSRNFNIKRPLILRDSLNKFLLTLIYHLMIVLAVIYFFKLYNTSRSQLITGYALIFLFAVIQRSTLFFFLDYIRKKGYNHRQILIIGDEKIAKRLQLSFANHPEHGYDLADFISEEQILAMPESALFDTILSKRPDEIFVCYKQLHNELLQSLIHFGDENFIKIKVVSDLILNNNYARLIHYNDVPVLHITSHPEISLKIRLLKRAFDVGFSLFIMVLGAPVFVMLYLITKFSSKGPAFYRQERIGQNEKPFYIYKFRSMHVNSERFGPQLSKGDNDPRITKWGRIIRKTRLDELPQFWNVLKGDMSVVGPRPERQHYIEKIIEKTPNYKKLLRVKPGVTSIGQVHYGYAENVDQMCDRVRYDLLYLQNINLNSDLNIIFKTVKVMVQGKGK